MLGGPCSVVWFLDTLYGHTCNYFGLETANDLTWGYKRWREQKEIVQAVSISAEMIGQLID